MQLLDQLNTKSITFSDKRTSLQYDDKGDVKKPMDMGLSVETPDDGLDGPSKGVGRWTVSRGGRFEGLIRG